MAHSALSPRTRTTFAVLLLVVLALAPAKLTRWLSVLRDPVMTIIAPISGPASALSIALRRGGTAGTPEELDLEQTRTQLSEYKVMYNQTADRVRELESLVAELQNGVEAIGGYRFTPLEASARVMQDAAAGTIEINRGSRHGVKPNTIALSRRSQQLIGIVSRVGLMTSTIQVITDKRSEPKLMRAVIMPEDPVSPEQMGKLFECQLKSGGDGTLISDLPIPADIAASLKPGQEVRLKDDQWPATAQMCLLGRVLRVEETRDRDLLHRNLRVAPDLDSDLTRVKSLILHIPIDDGAAPAAQPQNAGARP